MSAAGAAAPQRKVIGKTWVSDSANSVGAGYTSSGHMQDVWGVDTPAATAPAAAAPAAPAVPNPTKPSYGTRGNDVAYTGGDANALQMNTMGRRRGAASAKLRTLLG